MAPSSLSKPPKPRNQQQSHHHHQWRSQRSNSRISPFTDPSSLSAPAPASSPPSPPPPADHNPNPNQITSHRSKLLSASWLHQWDPPPTTSAPEKPPPSISIERIVHKLRTLEFGSNEEEELNQLNALNGDEKLGELLERSWNLPDQSQALNRVVKLPWEREEFAAAGENEMGMRKRVIDD